MNPDETFTLDPTCPVLPRPCGSIQIGWAPRRAVIVDPSVVAPRSALLELLHDLTAELTVDDIRKLQCAKHFHSKTVLDELIGELVDVGAVIRRSAVSTRVTPTVRIEGRGPLSDALTQALRRLGAHTQQSVYKGRETVLRGVDLVIVADNLVADPRLARAMHRQRVPHLAVRARDGNGLIGPMVLPGFSSCLGCADRHRGDRDDAWPAVAAQLAGTIGIASPATVLGTVGVALAEVEIVLMAIRGERPRPATPATLNATLELDLVTHSLMARRWTPHPLCDCGAYG